MKKEKKKIEKKVRLEEKITEMKNKCGRETEREDERDHRRKGSASGKAHVLKMVTLSLLKLRPPLLHAPSLVAIVIPSPRNDSVSAGRLIEKQAKTKTISFIFLPKFLC